MRKEGLTERFITSLAGILLSAFFVASALAQSTNQTFPTPVTTNEINGVIKARDIGDARLTGYFYTFNGTQGDIFVNVVTKNFNGDIDIFAVEGLRSLTKIVIYADSSSNETGRLIYLRKPEKLLLRIEGRSPNDDPATFRIKFGGSFVAAAAGPETEAPEIPEIKSGNDSDVIVNSVGTIIGVRPKPTPTPKETVVARVEPPPVKPDEEPEKAVEKPEAAAEKDPEKIRVLVSENIPPAAPKKEVKKPVRKPVKPTPKKTDETVEKDDTAKDAELRPVDKPVPAARTPKKPKVVTPKPPPAPDPLENVRLVILFKDGKKIERPMSEVIRFNVDKGVLTVVLKDGTMSKHSILDVEKVTIE
jgi:hypothetical protein